MNTKRITSMFRAVVLVGGLVLLPGCSNNDSNDDGVCLLHGGVACNDSINESECEFGLGDWRDTNQSCRDLGFS